MKGKLIKENNGYTLFVDGKVFGDTDGHQLKSITNRLSTKNCQAIERGYDLNELAGGFAKTKSSHPTFQNTHKRDFIEGFQKALELMGDKKFSEDDMSKSWSEGYHRRVDEINGNELRYFDKFIQSLQKTEWDVEIVEVRQRCHLSIGDWVSEDENGEFPMSINGAFGYRYIPKLDSDGCLILKGISK